MRRELREVSVADWHEEGLALFGKEKMDFAWKCPACGVKILSREYMALGAPSGALAVHCIGNWVKDDRGCNYVGSVGLVCLNPVRLLLLSGETVDVMEWWPND